MSRTVRRVPAATVGLALLATLLVSAPPSDASRTVSETYRVPASGTLKLKGHGFGHGHGMSQYGARGAALQGLTYPRILAFYYPGTSLGRAAGPIRVLITADTDNDVRVVPVSGLQVREVGGTSYTLPTISKNTTWRLRTVSGRTVLEYYTGSWHRHRPGGKALNGAAEFLRPGDLTLRVAGTTRVYHGTLRFIESNTVNVLNINHYVKGVVPREMPTSWERAAVRSQAVAARTYAAWERTAHPTRSYQTCDTTSCQVYGGVDSEDSRGNDAVVATVNRVLNYGGKPAFTQFGSSSGGWLSKGSMPYLVAKADKYDGFSGNPNHDWDTTLKRATIQNAYPRLGTLRRVLVTQRDGHGAWYGRVERMTLDGGKANVTLTGDEFRSRFGLRSSWFKFG